MTGPRKVEIAGTGSFVPERVLSNFDLEKMVDTSDEWIQQRTGMRERRIVSEGETNSYLAAEAGLNAVKAAGLRPEDLDAILVATVTPDHLFPSTACLTQQKMKAGNAGAFDLLAACTGFIAGFSTGWAYVSSGMFDNVLVLGSECLSRITNYSDRNTCVLFGDGAGAVLLRPAEGDHGSRMLHWELHSDGTGADFMRVKAGGATLPASMETVEKGQHYMEIQGREVFKFAVNRFADLMDRAMKTVGVTEDDVTLVVPHQVNARILEPAAKKVHFPMDKIAMNLDRYGNTSAASIPLAFDEAVREGRVKRGDLVIFIAFGAGLTWGSCVFRF
ncbi:MAG: beta-ketoacyl-ACP synthase III [Planctomycetota bacterium]|jgi:3-oxoacyl-[acyl-carrier-protein] synthase-3